MSRFSGKKCNLLTMIFLTTCFMLVEIMTGYATKSMALITDSFHMLSDSLALMVAYLSVLMSQKKWTKNTFGWARAEVFGALVNAVFLVALCFSISIEACKRFIEVEPIRNPTLIVFVGALGLLVNVLGLFLFHDNTGGHGHLHGGISRIHTRLTQFINIDTSANVTQLNNIDTSVNAFNVDENNHFNVNNNHSASQMNIQGIYLHLLADAFGSVIAIVSALIVWLTDWKFRHYMDPVLSLLLVVVILYSTWPLLHESALILLQTVPTHIEIKELHEKLLEIDGVLAVHEFHVWQLTGDKIIATAHIRCKDISEYMELAERIKEFFHNEGIHSTTIQPEFIIVKMTDRKKQNNISSEDCVLDCPETDNISSCQQQQCCSPSKQNHHTSSSTVNQLDNTTSITNDANSS